MDYRFSLVEGSLERANRKGSATLLEIRKMVDRSIVEGNGE